MNKISRRRFMEKAATVSAVGYVSSKIDVGELMANQLSIHSEAYHSQWHRLPDRYWTGPDTWANPWEDWQIQQGKLVCIKNGRGKRNVHCLTHQLNEKAASAEISITIEYCGSKTSETGKDLVKQIAGNKGDKALGSAGFELGMRVDDPIDDYRSRLLFGSGIHVGLTGSGQLFIGHDTHLNSPALAMALAAGKPVRLSCKLSPEKNKNTFKIELQAAEVAIAEARDAVGKVYGKVDKTDISPEQLVGNVAVVNNLPWQSAGMKPLGLYAFSNWTIGGPKVTGSCDHEFGPILWTLYTLSNQILKMTAQMPPIGKSDSDMVELQTRSGSQWKTVATAKIDPLSYTATFRVTKWDDSVDIPYRVLWQQKYTDGKSSMHAWSGTIQKDPIDKPEIVVAGYCCFKDYLFPNADIVEQTRKLKPDVMFFMGDQIYEDVGGFGILRTGDLNRMTINYVRKVALLGWSIRELTKSCPTVWMPDDHDVYQGNLWGAGGRKITLEEWRSQTEYHGSACVGAKGGYVQPAEFVKAVERTQTAHLPDPYDPTPIEQGIGVYYTSMTYGRVSFAILEDRKFKSGPMSVFKHKGRRADWIDNRADAIASNVPDAVLLGERQLTFLNNWITDWRGADSKIAVSQTIFCNAATHHGHPEGMLVGDMDSNGWPQQGRNKALDVLRRGHALMLGGDQHLPTIIQHGIEQHHDAGFSFCVPAGATGYQRWFRPEEVDHMQRDGQRHEGRANTGKYADGFGNLIDVHAVANPPIKRTAKTRLTLGQQKSAGFGVVRINKPKRQFTLEAWPVGIDPTDPNSRQYPGWPMTISQEDNYGRKAEAYLPTIKVEGVTGPVLQVIDESNNQVIYALRIKGKQYQPRVFKSGTYTIRIDEPETNRMKVLKNIPATQKCTETITVRFE